MRFSATSLTVTNTRCGIPCQCQINHFLNAAMFKDIFLSSFRLKYDVESKILDDQFLVLVCGNNTTIAGKLQNITFVRKSFAVV